MEPIHPQRWFLQKIRLRRHRRKLGPPLGVLLVIMGILAGCGGKSVLNPHEGEAANSHRRISGQDRYLQQIRHTLYDQYHVWHVVPYKTKGLSKSGVDCSGFVYLTYQHRFGVQLPRSTREQARVGKKVTPDLLHAGDLVFFKTGLFVRHVGIYVEADTFLHASTRQGITLSSLGDPYWAPRFWQARRILSPPRFRN